MTVRDMRCTHDQDSMGNKRVLRVPVELGKACTDEAYIVCLPFRARVELCSLMNYLNPLMLSRFNSLSPSHSQPTPSRSPNPLDQ